MFYGYGSNFGYAFGHVLDILLWVVIVIVIVRLLRGGPGWRYRHGGPWDRWGDRSLDILKERYAKGEIGKEEFEAKKKDLLG